MPLPCQNPTYASKQLNKSTYIRLARCRNKVVEAKTMKYKRKNKYVLVDMRTHKELHLESDKQRLEDWKHNNFYIKDYKYLKIFEVK